MHKADPLIRTKLRLPFTRPVLVPRPRLQEQIAQGLRGPLTLITAPAGFGKTTLAAAYVAGSGLTAAWLSLDKDDNRAGRFLSYLVAALQGADMQIGSEAAQMMAELQQAPDETILTSLINDLDNARKEFILVLDDYQFITSQAVHDEVTFLLEHCPSTFHLVIASRSDPPLPLSRLRARGQTVEIRAADLRFTEPEAAQFLNGVMGHDLEAGSVAVLENRTEGWITGLQMASLAMQGSRSLGDPKNIHNFIEGFSGTNRYILDYLVEEVLATQPPEIQRFLLCTSILERLTAPLCASILEGEKLDGWNIDKPSLTSQPAGSFNCQQVLEYLDRANIFLVSLDDERKWYRYHHLFADLLRSQLGQLHPGLSPRLHILAAGWFETNGLSEEAIHHALASGDYPGAARLVEAVAENAWLDGQYVSILAWTKAIPAELVHSRPWLCIWNAWAFTQMGPPRSLYQWITAAELSIKNQSADHSSIAGPGAPHDIQELMNEIAALRAFAVSFSKQYDRSIELAETVLKTPPLKNKKVAQFTRCNILHLLSSMYYATGNLLKAEQTCQETIELAKEMAFTLRLLHAANKLILINNINGNLFKSFHLIEETMAFLQEEGFDNYFAISQLIFRKIELLYEWNQLEEFQRLVEFVINQKNLLIVPYLLVDSDNILALDRLIKQDYRGSQDYLNKASEIARQSYIYEGLTWPTERLQVRLWLKSGSLSLAAAWASQQAADPGGTLRFPGENQAIARVRIFLAQGACGEAVSLLDRLANLAEIEGRKGSLLEIRTLRAIAFLGLGKLGQAGAEIENALALAEPEGYVRTFLDEDQPMLELLGQAANHALSPQAKYAQRLVTMFREEKERARAASEPVISPEKTAHSLPGAPNASLIEPLSGRELEVLHLMALGKTNQEIASQLIIAPGTIKAHAASIYRKLDAANRTEAVARARQVGILP